MSFFSHFKMKSNNVFSYDWSCILKLYFVRNDPMKGQHKCQKGEVGVRCLCGYGRWTNEPRQAIHQHDFQGD